MGSQVRVTIASELVYRTNYSIQASAIHFRVSVASGFTPAEPPTIARPRHQSSLGFFHYQRTATGTTSAMPCAKLSLKLLHRTRSGVTGALLQCIKDKTTSLTMPP